MKGTFLTLNPNARIFEELKIQNPKWWQLFCEDKDIYIDIRKDNYINIYYYGGSIAQIKYQNRKYLAKIHQKYLGDDKPRGKTKKGKDKYEYDNLELKTLSKKLISDIKKRIKSVYLSHMNSKKPAEKWIQGKMILEDSNYIDSEFQYNKDSQIGKLRMDLIKLSNGTLSFIELKGISDSRLRNDKKRNPKPPEIIEQMKKYSIFINKYSEELTEYYKNLIKLKRDLGLIKTRKINFKLNKIPKLIIVNTYDEGSMTKGKKERIYDIKELLDRNDIEYEIFPCEL